MKLGFPLSVSTDYRKGVTGIRKEVIAAARYAVRPAPSGSVWHSAVSGNHARSAGSFGSFCLPGFCANLREVYCRGAVFVAVGRLCPRGVLFFPSGDAFCVSKIPISHLMKECAFGRGPGRFFFVCLKSGLGMVP